MQISGVVVTVIALKASDITVVNSVYCSLYVSS
jgi:hypothetical protein